MAEANMTEKNAEDFFSSNGSRSWGDRLKHAGNKYFRDDSDAGIVCYSDFPSAPKISRAVYVDEAEDFDYFAEAEDVGGHFVKAGRHPLEDGSIEVRIGYDSGKPDEFMNIRPENGYKMVGVTGKDGSFSMHKRLDNSDLSELEQKLQKSGFDATEISIKNFSENRYELDLSLPNLPKLRSIETVGFVGSRIDLSKDKEIETADVRY